MSNWKVRVVRRVSRNEGGYDSLNLNTDRAGLSVGILQWSQISGGLGRLLAAWYNQDPKEFSRIFGLSCQALLTQTANGGMEPLDGAPLWKSPWVARFRQACQLPAWQAVQDELATQGQYMDAAIQAATRMGVHTERSVTLAYDTAVQQGPSAALREAAQAAAANVGASDMVVMEAFARGCADCFRTTAPPSVLKKGHLEWRLMPGGDWHRFAGKIDLYADIKRRRLSILGDRTISDDLLEF